MSGNINTMVYKNIQNAENFVKENVGSAAFFSEICDIALSLMKKVDDYTADEIEAIMIIDDALQNYLSTRTSIHLLNTSTINPRFGLNQNDQKMIEYLQNIAKIYSTMLVQTALRAKAPQSLSLKLASRTLLNLNRAIKWILFDFSIPGENIWLCINSTFKLIERLDLLNSPMNAYSHTIKTTIADQFLLAHMLNAIRSGYFCATEVTWTVSVLEKFSDRINIKSTPCDTFCFSCEINSKQPALPYKPNKQEKVNPDQRFWSMDPIIRILNQCRVSILVGNTPAELSQLNITLSHHPAFLENLLEAWGKPSQKIEPKTFLGDPQEITCTIGLNHINRLYQKNQPLTQPIFTLSLLSIEEEEEAIQQDMEENKNEAEGKAEPLSAQIIALGNDSIDISFIPPSIGAFTLGSLILWERPENQNDYKQKGIGFFNRIQRDGNTIKANIIRLGINPILSEVVPIKNSDKAHLWSKSTQVLLCKNTKKEASKYHIISPHHPNGKNNIWGLKLKNRLFSFQTGQFVYSTAEWCITEISILEEVTEKN